MFTAQKYSFLYKYLKNA